LSLGLQRENTSTNFFKNYNNKNNFKA